MKLSTMWHQRNAIMIISFLLSDILTGCEGKVNQTNHESKLIKYLMDGYDKNTRPVLNQSHAVTVYFGIAYSELINMDAKNQILTSNVWVRQRWKDPWLTWNASDYAGITSINMNPEYLWRPDIMLHNNVDDENHGEMFLFKTPMIVSSDGTIMWFSPNKIKSSCKVDITYFPFDTQTCKLTFGLWTYHGFKVDIQFIYGENRADLAKFTKNGEWQLVSAEGKRNVFLYNCCTEPYPDLTYHIKIKRRTLFYINNLIIPCILLALLAAASFLFPPETGERIALVITVLLGMTVFMLIFTEAIPPNSESQSLIGRYFAAILIEIAMSLFLTCGVLRFYHHNPEKEVPSWARKFVFGILGRIFGCGLCFRRRRVPTIKDLREKSHEMQSSQSSMKDVIQNSHVNEHQPNSLDNNLKTNVKINTTEITVSGMDTVCDYLTKIQSEERRRREWHALVKILDTFSFWLFVITIFISTVALLPVT